jgi:HEPN domain-containing protein
MARVINKNSITISKEELKRKGGIVNLSLGEYKKLCERAEEFFKEGKEDILKERYDLAAFHFDQATQLYLKYYLFLKIRRYTKTHSLKKLLTALGKVYHKENVVEKMKERDINLISDLEQAYITSRYLPAELTKKQVENMRDWVIKLINFLKKL